MRSFRVTMLATLLLLLLPAVAAAQPEFGYIDGLVASYIESFNSGDGEKMIAFFREYGVPSMEPVKNEERARRLYRILEEELGTIAAETVDVSPGGEVEVGIRASDGRPRVIQRGLGRSGAGLRRRGDRAGHREGARGGPRGPDSRREPPRRGRYVHRHDPVGGEIRSGPVID